LKFRAWIAALVALPFTTSCSLMFVDGPPPVGPRGGYAPAGCTTSNAWPVVDVLWTGNFLLNMAVLGGMSDEELQKRDLTRGSAIGINVGLAALAVTSAIVGFTRVRECQDQLGSAVRSGYGPPQRLIAPPRATRMQEEAEEEAAVQAQMRARTARPAGANEPGEDAPAVTPTPAPAPAAPQSPTTP
jgi:hypothetical protein